MPKATTCLLNKSQVGVDEALRLRDEAKRAQPRSRLIEDEGKGPAETPGGQGKGVVPMENPSDPRRARCPVLDGVSYCL